MLSDNVMATLKKIISEEGLEDIISVSENINKMADFMIIKIYNGLEMLAIEGKPLFPFYSIKNLFFDNRDCTMHFSSEDIHLRILFDLCYDYRFIYELGDQGDSWIIKKYPDSDEEETFYNREDVINELKIFNDKYNKQLSIENLIWSLIPSDNNYSVKTEAIQTIEKVIWDYIMENPEDQETVLFFAHQMLDCKMNDEDNKVVIDIEKIMSYIKTKKLEYNLLTYIRNEWLDENGELYLPGAFLEELSMAMKYLDK